MLKKGRAFPLPFCLKDDDEVDSLFSTFPVTAYSPFFANIEM